MATALNQLFSLVCNRNWKLTDLSKTEIKWKIDESVHLFIFNIFPAFIAYLELLFITKIPL